ncbi:MAG: hypothetical protein ICV59_04420 [Thermoleophilia bacterium]|nr:hypothetical protein [Thermoleophilia bacterium]
MRRSTVRRAAALAAALATLAACGSDGSDVPETVAGTIVSLEYEGGLLRSFTVRDGGGETHELFVDGDVSYGFDLDHLRQHRADGAPVRCDVERRNGELIALTIEDM